MKSSACISGHVCAEMTEEFSSGRGVPRKHSMAEFTLLRLEHDLGHQHPAGLAQHLAGQKGRRPRPLQNDKNQNYRWND